MRISMSARLLPAQLPSPYEKGMNAAVLVTIGVAFSLALALGGRVDREGDGSQRSGQKLLGAGEKCFGSRAIT